MLSRGGTVTGGSRTHAPNLLLAKDREEHCVGSMSMRPQLHCRTLAAVGNLGQQGPRILLLNVAALAKYVGHDELGLGKMR